MPVTSQLKAPPSDIATRSLDLVAISPTLLCRVSRHNTGEPYFGKSGACRFDDATLDVAQRFGTCYLGFNLTVAFAESVLHDLEPDSLGFSVPTTEISSRFALSFKAQNGNSLKLAKMFGTPLLLLGGHGELSGTHDYTLPQAWANALVAHPEKIDGFIYMSRRLNNDFAVVLFHRPNVTPPDMCIDQAIPLYHHIDCLPTLKTLGVRLT